MLIILVSSFAINVLLAAAQNAKDPVKRLDIKNSRLAGSLPVPVHNITTYIDKTENILRVPDLKKNYEEHKTKRKNLKKSPKRTIQKIIKKNRSKKRLYINQATIMPTKAPITGDELDQFYAKEEMLQKNESNPPQQVLRKKKKNWPATRYPAPFQHLIRKDKRRNKRSAERDDLFILTDLDEMKFLEEGKEENVVNAHVKKYW